MEFAVSAITGDLCSRFISYLLNKSTDRSSPEEKLERLQNLLIRLHTVVEEAEGRYITNSQMLVQLKMITQALYRGYQALGNFQYSRQAQTQRRAGRVLPRMQRPADFLQLSEKKTELEVSCSNSWYSIVHAKRFRATESGTICDDIDSLLASLETIVADTKEFVIFLCGCERMCQRPYDTYLYVDNFMFGRVVEKQKIINILLQDNPINDAPVTVLPVLGGCRVGKKTLVWSVCNDDKIRSYFSSILHLKGEEIRRVDDHRILGCNKTLCVIEFVSDATDEDWEGFYSFVTKLMGRGSKIIVISRFAKLARFGTATAIFLNSMSPQEYSYLFNVLAFGSADPRGHPQLAAIGHELGTLLGGLLLSANIVAEMLRKNLDVQFWLHILRRYRKVVDSNLSASGSHPKALHEKDHPVDITMFSPSSSSRLRIMPPRSRTDDICTGELANVTFGNLVAGSCAVLPQEEFQIMVWESRMPPFTKFVASCVEEKVQCTALAGEKRSRELDS
ncbi:hypothetical protein ACQ4PT_027640 [Festuca glaucescens]